MVPPEGEKRGISFRRPTRELPGSVSSDPNMPARPIVNNASSPQRRPANSGSLMDRPPFGMPHSGDSRPGVSGRVVMIPLSRRIPRYRVSLAVADSEHLLAVTVSDSAERRKKPAAIAFGASCTDVRTVDMQLPYVRLR